MMHFHLLYQQVEVTEISFNLTYCVQMPELHDLTISSTDAHSR